ncbi:YlbE-like family protein [Bacillus massiliigorillae]|uniref:YlbE-like family protein n=1 Tax=Bacillus massiliigorillae TaxID=1243664 RepID=UPI0003A20C2D|nr:YlbE-like family protein [Bacillus massiliigorillae]
MRQDLYEWIKNDGDQLQYLRLQPIWYRKLTRNPQEIEKFGTDTVFHFEKSIPQRVNKLTNGVQVASMMLGMLQSMNFKG